MEKWCGHIQWVDARDKSTFLFEPGWPGREGVACAEKWTFCPICGTPKPKPAPKQTLAEVLREIWMNYSGDVPPWEDIAEAAKKFIEEEKK